MRIVLSGYRGSQKIIGASSYLLAKYLKDCRFDIHWLNYGPYDGPLFIGEYTSLAEWQQRKESWAHDIKNYLEKIDDRLIIFALDDYFISGPMNTSAYRDLAAKMGNGVVCARLCMSDFYKPHEAHQIGSLIYLTDKAQYSATTQYCIWDREALIEILAQVKTPWEFEIGGSQILNHSGKKVIGRLKATLPYSDLSALSQDKWSGKINVRGSSRVDIEELLQEGLLNQDDLIGYE